MKQRSSFDEAVQRHFPVTRKHRVTDESEVYENAVDLWSDYEWNDSNDDAGFDFFNSVGQQIEFKTEKGDFTFIRTRHGH